MPFRIISQDDADEEFKKALQKSFEDLKLARGAMNSSFCITYLFLQRRTRTKSTSGPSGLRGKPLRKKRMRDTGRNLQPDIKASGQRPRKPEPQVLCCYHQKGNGLHIVNSCEIVYLGPWPKEAFNYFTLYQDIMHGLWTRIKLRCF